MNVLDQLHFLSRLIQPRGLKSLLPDDIQVFDTVEAYTASWIEILLSDCNIFMASSRLIQPRGLKSLYPYTLIIDTSRGLYSLVD